MKKFDLKQVVASKAADRQRRSRAPIAEKLRMLDALRERHVTLRGESQSVSSGARRRSNHNPPRQ
jgi:hypothetical protein